MSRTIPGEVFLGALTHLDVRNGYLVGTIPASAVPGLIRLRHLDLSLNALSGTLPQLLSTLTQLTFLSLCRNQLQGTSPPWAGSLPFMQVASLLFAAPPFPARRHAFGVHPSPSPPSISQPPPSTPAAGYAGAVRRGPGSLCCRAHMPRRVPLSLRRAVP